MLGHRHVTTTEICLHYTPDAEGSAKHTELWGDRASEAAAHRPRPM